MYSQNLSVSGQYFLLLAHLQFLIQTVTISITTVQVEVVDAKFCHIHDAKELVYLYVLT